MREFFFTFAFIFMAALPGRTTFILIFLAASMRPWRVLMGSLPAFLIQCALGVIAGRAVRNVPPVYTESAAGALFLYFAFKFWRDARHSENEGVRVVDKSIAAIFVLFFMAEFGDVSQLAVASRAAQVDSAMGVFLGAAAAMSAIAILAVFAGRVLGTKLKPATLQRLAAVLFFALGAYLLAVSLMAIAPF